MKNKRIDLEIIRIIAAFFVIFNHSGKYGYLLYSHSSPNQISFWIYLSISILCKIAVPLFFAVSGILLLKKDDTPKILFKRIIRMIVVLIVISAIYFVFNYYEDNKNFNIVCFLKLLYSNNVEFHLWFIYQYIAFLLILPVLRAIVKGIGDNVNIYKYVIILSFLILSVFPSFDWIVFKANTTINTMIIPNIITNNIFIYPILGYYLDNYFKITNKSIFISQITYLSCIIFACFLTYYRVKLYPTSNYADEAFNNMFSLVGVIAAFVLIKFLSNKIKFNDISKKIIYSIGECTFGIYLIHIIARKYLITDDIHNFLFKFTHNYMISSLLITFTIMFICYIIIYFIRKIPYVKKYI